MTTRQAPADQPHGAPMSATALPVPDRTEPDPLESALDEVAREGYAVRTALDPDLVAELLDLFHSLEVGTDAVVYRTFMDESRETARRIDLALKELLGPVVERVTPGYRPFLATYCYKGTEGGEVPYHQDWSFTDERQARGIAWWIPLVTVGEQNGGLAVIPRSHRWTAGLRVCSQVVDAPIVPHQDDFRSLCVTVPLEPGSVVLYDTALVHGSEPVHGGGDRPAIVLQTGPEGCDIVHFQLDLTALRGYLVDEAYFSTQEYESRPEGYPELEPWTRPVVASDFDEPLRVAKQAAAAAAAPQVAPKPTRFIDRLRRSAR